jgi:hypothetical protein
MHVDDIQEVLDRGHDDSDHIYEAARDAGLIDNDHDGPFSLELDEDTVSAYLAERRAAGNLEPFRAYAPYGKEKQREVVKAALTEAYSEIPVRWLVGSNGLGKTRIQQGFDEAATSLRAIFTDPQFDEENLDFKDREIIDVIRGITTGTDPRGGTFKEQATYASALLADWLIKRDDYLAVLDAD